MGCRVVHAQRPPPRPLAAQLRGQPTTRGGAAQARAMPTAVLEQCASAVAAGMVYRSLSNDGSTPPPGPTQPARHHHRPASFTSVLSAVGPHSAASSAASVTSHMHRDSASSRDSRPIGRKPWQGARPRACVRASGCMVEGFSCLVNAGPLAHSGQQHGWGGGHVLARRGLTHTSRHHHGTCARGQQQAELVAFHMYGQVDGVGKGTCVKTPVMLRR